VAERITESEAKVRAIGAVEEYARLRNIRFGEIVFRIQDGRVLVVRREEQERVGS